MDDVFQATRSRCVTGLMSAFVMPGSLLSDASMSQPHAAQYMPPT